ncbi:MAG: haloacid dehalogenase-like hydrolase [Hyphomonadaceae bacterium]
MKKRTALVYDFDGTLAPVYMQNGALLPKLGVKDPIAYWNQNLALARGEDGDQVLIYLRRLIEIAREKGVALTRELLNECGRGIAFFEGVEDWFDRIDAFADSIGLELEHYVISAGNLEIIEGCAIFPKFTKVYACKYHFDEKGDAVWPNVAINYTTKTQYLFRINKGVHDNWNQVAVNEWMPDEERPVPFSRMIYLGDGDTDIPSFKSVTTQDGYAIAVIDPAKWNDAQHRDTNHSLIAEARVNFVVAADYRETSALAVGVRGILDRIARAERVHPKFFKNGAFRRPPAE